MQALDLLLNRRSQPRLVEPAPQDDALENIMQAGLAAPDHKCLTPWRFIVCVDGGLQRLGSIFEQAAMSKHANHPTETSEASIKRAPQLPLRAPMVIVAICDYKQDDKVPRVEQLASTACAVQSMQMAALAQGFQGIWRTGWYAQDVNVKTALGCKDEDEILGFLYLGSSPLKTMDRPTRDSNQFVEHWS
jgi:nitroreductase